MRDGDLLLTPGGGRWTLNLAGGRPTRIRLRGRDVPARPELVTDPAELQRLLGVIAEKNPGRPGSSPTTADHVGFEAVAFAVGERDRRSRPVLGG